MTRQRRSSWRSVSLAASLLAVSSQTKAASTKQPAEESLQESLLTATVNGVANPTPMSMLRGPDNQIYATSSQLKALRIVAEGLPPIMRQGKEYYLINAVPGATLKINENDQELQIDVPPSGLAQTKISYAPIPIDEKIVRGTGAYINYDINVQKSNKGINAGAALESVIFTPHGVGINTLVATKLPNRSKIVRLETNWTIDDPKGLKSFRIGDSITRGSSGARPFRFAGLQFARNFEVEPGYITIPLPAINGSAQIPSVADIYINNKLTQSTDLPPGLFNISDIPVINGNGNVQIVVRDLIGRRQIINRPYYSSLIQLRKGLSDYSYEIGFIRRSFGQKSNDYGSPMISGTHRYGFSNRFTGEFHLEATRHTQVAGVGGSLAIPRLGRLETSVSQSYSKLGRGSWESFTLERRTQNSSFGLHAEFASSNYTSVGASPKQKPFKSIIQAFAGVSIKSSSVSVSYIDRKSRGDEPSARFVTANWTMPVAKIGSLNLAVTRNIGKQKTTSAEMFFTFPIGSRTSVSTSAIHDQGSNQYGTSIQQSLPVGSGLGYYVNLTTGRSTQEEGRLSIRTAIADYEAQIAHGNGQNEINLSTSGSIGIARGDPFATRRINGSFAIVKVGEYNGVHVYADNQLVGKTNKKGVKLIPMIRSYDRNMIRIDARDLPFDAQIPSEEQIIRPYYRSGATVDFQAKPAHAVLVEVKLEDGAPLPTGSSIKLKDRNDEIFSAEKGVVYLTELKPGTDAIAQWENGTCQFTVDLPQHPKHDEQKYIEAICRTIALRATK